MRGKLEQSVPIADRNKIRAQKGALEKLCRVLQTEIREVRKRVPRAPQTAQPPQPKEKKSPPSVDTENSETTPQIESDDTSKTEACQ